MSGRAAGIRLAYYDRPVCILERHTTIGGLNSFYRLRGRNYDVGLHAVTNYAPPGTKTGPLAKLLKQLRLRWDDFDLSPQLGSAVVFPQTRLRFNNDFELLWSEVAAAFPQQADAFNRLTAHIDAFEETRLDQPAVSARAVIAEFLDDPLLTDMLLCPLMFYGSARPDDMDFSQFCIMFKSIFEQGLRRSPAADPKDARPAVQGVRRRPSGGMACGRSSPATVMTGVVLDDGRG